MSDASVSYAAAAVAVAAAAVVAAAAAVAVAAAAVAVAAAVAAATSMPQLPGQLQLLSCRDRSSRICPPLSSCSPLPAMCHATHARHTAFDCTSEEANIRP